MREQYQYNTVVQGKRKNIFPRATFSKLNISYKTKLEKRSFILKFTFLKQISIINVYEKYEILSNVGDQWLYYELLNWLLFQPYQKKKND